MCANPCSLFRTRQPRTLGHASGPLEVLEIAIFTVAGSYALTPPPPPPPPPAAAPTRRADVTVRLAAKGSQLGFSDPNLEPQADRTDGDELVLYVRVASIACRVCCCLVPSLLPSPPSPGEVLGRGPNPRPPFQKLRLWIPAGGD